MLITKVRLGQVHPHPHNIRRDIGDVTELAESFGTSGMLQPLVVAPALKRGAVKGFTLIAGHRRFAAAKLLGWSDVEVIVRDDLNTEALQTEAMLIENLQRTNLSPIEEADAYEQLIAFDYTPERIAERAGRSIKLVKSRLALRKLAAPVSAKVHAGQISLADAEALAAFDGDPKALAKLNTAIGTNNFHYTLEQVKRDKQAAATKARLDAHAAKLGVKVVKVPEYDSHPRDWAFMHEVVKLDKQDRTPTQEEKALLAAHKGCPHGAVYVRLGWLNDLALVCTQPKTHPSFGKSAAPRETAAERKERIAAETLKAELATASATRLAFLREMFAAKTFDPVPALRMLIIRRIEARNEVLAPALKLLGLQPPKKSDAARDVLVELVTGLTTVPAVTSVWLALAAGSLEYADYGLLRPYTWSNTEAKEWAALLVGYGYELCDVEQRMLAPVEKPIADTAERVVETARCRACGCTDDEACEGGCSWVDDEHTLCSMCAAVAVSIETVPPTVEDVTPSGEFAAAL